MPPPRRSLAGTGDGGGVGTPVCLLTGFLGRFKTTLLNRALKEPALADTANVVNELGEIGLDT